MNHAADEGRMKHIYILLQWWDGERHGWDRTNERTEEGEYCCWRKYECAVVAVVVCRGRKITMCGGDLLRVQKVSGFQYTYGVSVYVFSDAWHAERE